jgi:pantothenate synthetase
LNAEQGRQALALSRSLLRVQELYEGGERDVARLTAAGAEEFLREPGVRLDFLEIVDADSLEPLETAGPGALVAVAGFLGSTRLIDNVVL